MKYFLLISTVNYDFNISLPHYEFQNYEQKIVEFVNRWLFLAFMD